MRIKGTCTNCGREFLPEQVVASGGHCPWCGKAFDRDYTALLNQALQQAARAGDDLQAALEQIADLDEVAMVIDEEGVLQPLLDALRKNRRNAGRRRASRV
jgi:predicted  nucleic acid-binding Zn-ribbon protein